MELRNKQILLISPQPWDSLHISKHHYAIELAKRGNIVYFLCRGSRRDGKLEWKESEIENLHLIYYSELFFSKIRYRLPFLYQVYLRLMAHRILNKLDKPFDIVWSFDVFYFKNLRWFKGGITIFHPVDKVKSNIPILAAKTADVIFSVAQNILDQFKGNGVPAFFINHGLAKVYAAIAKEPTAIKNENSIQFAYIGNITMEIIDHKRLMTVIKKHPEIQFDFYGQQESINPSKGVVNFLKFLKDAKNANLKGIYHSTDLSIALKKYDGFLLAYLPYLDPNQCSNSHKILEYLAYGKVIVSSKILVYEDYRGLIRMSEKADNSDFIELFNQTIANLSVLNTIEKGKMRKKIALNNTYAKKIIEIESSINKLRQ